MARTRAARKAAAGARMFTKIRVFAFVFKLWLARWDSARDRTETVEPPGWGGSLFVATGRHPAKEGAIDIVERKQDISNIASRGPELKDLGTGRMHSATEAAAIAHLLPFVHGSCAP